MSCLAKKCAGGTFFTSMPRSKYEELKSSFKIIKNQIKFNATKERSWLRNCASGTISTNAPRSKIEELKNSFNLETKKIKFNAIKERMLG